MLMLIMIQFLKKNSNSSPDNMKNTYLIFSIILERKKNNVYINNIYNDSYYEYWTCLFGYCNGR